MMPYLPTNIPSAGRSPRLSTSARPSANTSPALGASGSPSRARRRVPRGSEARSRYSSRPTPLRDATCRCPPRRRRPPPDRRHCARAHERGVEHGHFMIAPDERREPAGPRAIEAAAERPHGLEIEVSDRLTHALDRNAAETPELEVPLDEPHRVLRETDVPRLGGPLHALREADDVSLGRVLHAQVVADSTDDDLARIEPDAHRERQAVLGVDLARVGAGGVTQMERRVAGALRVVLVGDRRAEKRHAAVPSELVDEALEALDRSQKMRKKRCMICDHASGSSCSASFIEPFTSTKRTVTCLRSPSIAAFAWRIFSARSGGVVPPAIVSAVPQPPQNLSPTSIGAPQEGHPTANVAPHCVQKRRSDRLSWRQDGQPIGSQ